MVITEIFKSIQGESSFAGLPCVFVRLTGCNLRCHWCDTAYAFHGGEKMTVEQVLGRVRELGGKMVELTGGEPLLQKETVGLADSLLAEGYRVLIETSGERFVGDLARPVVKIVDVKCPGSGESGKFNLANLAVLERKDQMKFVVLDERDYLFARGFMEFAPKIIDAVRRGKTAVEHAATFEDGLKVQIVLDAARESNKTGAMVRI